ncbi:TRAP transporter large permease [Desulfovibrio ferrophilus]|uniref:TRAP transporter, DctM subunit n=1 Tax=Desulfovibrio ferrophilus TaxID=241368 RepID=A0A2Z6B0Y2_9BACT|nr:TRAP transporter large permease [Desulfovibrio ferrophilus]BBD09162.1 TRAP transporter, DctM subunit [Desulfovibrio ferrophilus]
MGTTLFLSFFIFVLVGVPIAVALGLSSLVALVMHSHVPLMVLVQKAYGGVDSFTLMAIPFFILAGNIMSSGGVSSRLVNLANCFFGRFPGGLAHVATAACTFFGAISGSAPATTAAIGSVMVGPMREKGYSRVFSAACVAASGTIGLLIPPSITMVLYGVITGASVGKLFLGGVLPGLLMCSALMSVNYVVAKRHGYGGGDKVGLGQTMKAIKDASLALLMPLIILGGIYGGVFTPTEAAVVAVVYGLIIGRYVYKQLDNKRLYEVVLSTAKSAAVIMFLVATAHCFSYLMASEQIPQALTNSMLSVSTNPSILLFMICASLLVVGTFLDNAVAVVLMAPIFHPVIMSAGIDPVYFGVLLVLTLSIGQVTPPVGLCLFVACDLGKVSIEKLSMGVLPYLLILVLVMVVLILCPDIVLFIPNHMMQ